MEEGVTKPTPEKAGEALHAQLEWLRVTLFSIGDAVITTDIITTMGITIITMAALTVTTTTPDGTRSLVPGYERQP